MYNELIESCLKHDKKAQELLFKTYYGKMLNICYRYTNDIDDAKDLLQEGFIKVFDNILLNHNFSIRYSINLDLISYFDIHLTSGLE